MKRSKPKSKTYEAKVNGRKRRVTVPEDPDPEEMLIDAFQANFSPKAVAAIASFLQTVRTNDHAVDQEVWWLIRMIDKMLGKTEMNRLIEELGL